jgi:2-polyprenyl-6-methoxyphenol hydroxylase-like FAD-dependent oxidoreductase
VIIAAVSSVLPRSLHVAIVGYGSAGQAAAVLLSADGHRVEVFERAARPGPVGAGLLLQPTGLGVLHEAGLLDAVLAHGAPVRRLYGESHAGRRVLDIRYDWLDPRLYGVGIQRGALFELLHTAWQGRGVVHAGQWVESADPDTGRLRTRDGRRHGPYDLVIAADGSASGLRGLLGAARLDRPYPWGALWCLVEAGDWPHADMLAQRYRRARQMVGLLPVGLRPGDPVRRLSFFWSVKTAEFAQWSEHRQDEFQQTLQALWPEAAPVFERLPRVDRLARASYRDAVLHRWHRGRLVAIGDAAHAMSPQLGQGVNMALLDAWALRDALRAGGRRDEVLARYEQQRKAHVGIYHVWSRWLTPLFQSGRDTLALLRDLGFARLSQWPVGRGQSLRVLTGTQHGWWGRMPLLPGLAEALAERAPAG